MEKFDTLNELKALNSIYNWKTLFGDKLHRCYCKINEQSEFFKQTECFCKTDGPVSCANGDVVIAASIAVLSDSPVVVAKRRKLLVVCSDDKDADVLPPNRTKMNSNQPSTAKKAIILDSEEEFESNGDSFIDNNEYDENSYGSSSQEGEGSLDSEEDSDESESSSKVTPQKEEKSRKQEFNKFTRNRQRLAREYFDLFNRKVFKNQLPSDSPLIWSKKLTSTAGFFRFKGLQIELSVKVLDTEERMRDTLAHEMCHFAAFYIDNHRESRTAHGKVFKKWGRAVTKAFPEVGEVTTFHNYKIFNPFKYLCSNTTTGTCGIDICLPAKKKRWDALLHGMQLGDCVRWKCNRDGEIMKEKAPTAFSLFVKEHFSTVKKQQNSSHKEVITTLSKMYSAKKLGKTVTAEGENASAENDGKENIVNLTQGEQEQEGEDDTEITRLVYDLTLE